MHMSAAAKPPRARRGTVSQLEVAKVGVNCGGHRIVRVEDKTDSTGPKLAIAYGRLSFEHRFGGHGGEGAMDGAHIDAGFFEDLALLEDYEESR